MKCCAEVKPGLYHCPVCHQTFGVLDIFDSHQDVNYNRSPRVLCKDLEGLGLVRDTWGTWRTPEDATATTERVAKMLAAKGGKSEQSKPQGQGDGKPGGRRKVVS